MGIVKAICISEKKGVQKHRIEEAVFVTDYGIEQDAHAGKWHRQVSLLSFDSLEAFKQRGASVIDGAFGENLIVDEFDFRHLPVGTVFQCNDVILEMTQIGKECHSHCEIYKIMGECIMPREGVFAKVIQGGTIHVGDEMKIIDQKDRFKVAVLTLSDKGAAGDREDKSGPLIREIVEKENYLVIDQRMIPDDQPLIEKTLIHLCDKTKADLVLTTGGTGFSMRDCTPEATIAVAHRMAPGISEAIRAYSAQFTNRAMLSRGASVIRGGTLIINLPGSPKAVRESLACILPSLDHGLQILKGTASECGQK
ncbi:MAG: MOSC domain-containing protein [Clostridia bacterium]|nr:MOSC domain-containing protein [Clostridia bacterium]NCC79913.1 MOSC domain-containing protein [Clostridia bacterium]